MRRTGALALLATAALTLALTACAAPPPDRDPAPDATPEPVAATCDELVTASVLSTSGAAPMERAEPMGDTSLELPGIPRSIASELLGALVCAWAGPAPADDGEEPSSPASYARLTVRALPDVAEQWNALAAVYGPQLEKSSCSTLYRGSAFCGTLRLLPNQVLVSIDFAGFAIEAPETDDESQTLDAATVEYAVIADDILDRLAAAPPVARELSGEPIANVPGYDCSELLPDATIAELAGSQSATSARSDWYPSFDSIALLSAGGGNCSWSATNEYDDPSEGETAHVHSSTGFGTVAWLSRAAGSIPTTSPSAAVDLTGLAVTDGAWLRENAGTPTIDIRVGEHWVSVASNEARLPEGTLKRFAQAVVDALVG